MHVDPSFRVKSEKRVARFVTKFGKHDDAEEPWVWLRLWVAKVKVFSYKLTSLRFAEPRFLCWSHSDEFAGISM